MNDLPEIHEITRWTPKPGDRLIVKNTEIEIDQETAGWLQRDVRRVLALPDDFPVIVLGRDWELEVLEEPA